MVCVFDGQGCGYIDGDTDECIGSAIASVFVDGEEVEDAVVSSRVRNVQLT